MQVIGFRSIDREPKYPLWATLPTSLSIRVVILRELLSVALNAGSFGS